MSVEIQSVYSAVPAIGPNSRKYYKGNDILLKKR